MADQSANNELNVPRPQHQRAASVSPSRKRLTLQDRLALQPYQRFPRLVAERKNANPTPTQTISFISLPYALRQRILHEALVLPYPIDLWPAAGLEQSQDGTTHPISEAATTGTIAGLMHRHLRPNLMRANRQLNREAATIFYGENKWRFTARNGWPACMAWLETIGEPNIERVRHLMLAPTDTESNGIDTLPKWLPQRLKESGLTTKEYTNDHFYNPLRAFSWAISPAPLTRFSLVLSHAADPMTEPEVESLLWQAEAVFMVPWLVDGCKAALILPEDGADNIFLNEKRGRRELPIENRMIKQAVADAWSICFQPLDGKAVKTDAIVDETTWTLPHHQRNADAVDARRKAAAASTEKGTFLQQYREARSEVLKGDAW